MTLPYRFLHHLVGMCFKGWVLNQGDQSVTLFVSAGLQPPRSQLFVHNLKAGSLAPLQRLPVALTKRYIEMNGHFF